jgi:integrase
MPRNQTQTATQEQISLKKMKFKTPRNRTENRPLTGEQVAAVMAKVDNHQDQAILHFGFNVGCRVSEVVSFTAETIDWQQGQVRIWDEKKDKYRWVMPPSETIQRLRMWINESKPGISPVFNISTKTVERIFQKWCKSALGFERSWHTVRHTYINISAENHVPVEVVMQNTGDSFETIIRYYREISPGFMRKIVDEKPVFAQSGLKTSAKEV